MRSWLGALVTLALCACAPLTAERPLFSVRDQIGPAPIIEGVWIAIDDHCPARMAHRRGRLPKACSPMRISRQPDGSWLLGPLTPRRPQANDEDAPYRFVLAPAIERPSAEAYAPIYVAEAFKVGAEDLHPNYVVIAPINALPAAEMYLIIVECGDILRDGPIAGVRVRYGAPGPANTEDERAIESCVASNQRAVREAARREVIESIAHLNSTHLMFVRP
jgi:hypothetical protein